LKLPTAASKKAKTAAGKTASSKKDGDDPNDDPKDTPKKTAKGQGGSDPNDFLQVHLDGEEDDKVPVYDTCADVRRKISAHLRDPGVTQAQFCRDLHSQLHGPEKGAKIQSTQLAHFRAMSGANQGGDNKIFYAGYVFFEKKRIAEGKPKSKKWQEIARNGRTMAWRRGQELLWQDSVSAPSSPLTNDCLVDLDSSQCSEGCGQREFPKANY
jgi:hypothetical protein